MYKTTNKKTQQLTQHAQKHKGVTENFILC